MNIYVLDGFKRIGIIESYQSVIWNVQYFGAGDLELTMAATEENLSLIKVGSYLVRDFDNIADGIYQNVMMVTGYNLDFDLDKGWIIKVFGKGLKNILSQRIIWNQTNLAGLTELAIRQVINENAINPTDTKRKIPNLILEDTNGFTDTIEVQLFSENVAEWLEDICQTNGYGWDIYIKNNQFVFKLYKGTDRTYHQSTVTPVIFSPEYDNLLTSSYKYDKQSFKNSALIGGEGEGVNQRTIGIGEVSGLDRFETYIDGGSVSSNGEIITVEQYNEMLRQFGQTELDKVSVTQSFEGDIDANGIYKINKDYFLGDLVQIENDKGIKATARITEIIYAEDESGMSVVPTFSEWEVER